MDHSAFSRTAERTGLNCSKPKSTPPPSHTSHSSVGRTNFMLRPCARSMASRFSSRPRLCTSASRQAGIRAWPTPVAIARRPRQPRVPAATARTYTDGSSRRRVATVCKTSSLRGLASPKPYTPALRTHLTGEFAASSKVSVASAPTAMRP